MIAVDDETVLTKLHRLQHEPGYRPTVVDLFSGCGGASLGFQREGCEILAGLEIEAVRAQTHAFNFHRNHQTLHGAPHDVTKLDPVGCLEILAGRPSPEVDIVVGGPPCQAYARVGRAKLLAWAGKSLPASRRMRPILVSTYRCSKVTPASTTEGGL